MNKNISVSVLFSEAWQLFKAHWKTVIFATVIVMLVQGIFEHFGYSYDADTNTSSGSMIMTLIGLFVSLALSIGMVDLFIRLSRGEDVGVSRLYQGFSWIKLWRYFVSSILYTIMLIIGFILFIIPGIIVMLMFFPYFYFIIDQDAGITESLRRARAVTKGNRAVIFVTIILMAIMNIVGALLFLVGLLITIPISVFVSVLLYRALIDEDISMDLEQGEVVVESEEDGDTEHTLEAPTEEKEA